MVVLTISDGKIEGKISRDINNKEFYSFQGIPYAAPPLGHLRFKAPKPIQPWPGIKNCKEEGSECISKNILTRKIVGSEDCLNLNVYTPLLPEAKKSLKPVMFFIHGGVFINGSNKTDLYGPEFLVAEDVVLITINYRLGYFGFLSLDDTSLGVPGNAGLKDMVMALKWVQRNIGYFNGDRSNVTVFGESAGGVSAHLLMLSPMSKGLIHKVIAQSGCAINSWTVGSRSARLIAAELGFHNTDDRKLLPFLQNVAAEDLVKTQLKFDNSDFAEHHTRTLGIVIEREAAEEEAFIVEHPIQTILSGNYSHIPMIIGYNWEEGMAFDAIAPPAARDRFFNNTESGIPLTLNLKRGSPISRLYAQKIMMFYYGSTAPISRKLHSRQYYSSCTDNCFLRDIYFTVKAHMRTALAPIYFYRLKLDTELNLYKKLAKIKFSGVCHGDDLGYLFKTALTPEIEPESIEDIGRRRITRMWSNFAKYGNPTPGNDNLVKIKWREIDRKDIHFLDIGEELEMDVNPENERMKFWTHLYKLNPIISKI